MGFTPDSRGRETFFAERSEGKLDLPNCSFWPVQILYRNDIEMRLPPWQG